MSSELQDELSRNCSLTKTQIQTIVLHKSVRKGDLSIKDALKRRARDGRDAVTLGAYYRVLEQARSNVRESVYTLLLCSWLNLLKSGDLEKLMQIVSKTPLEMDQETSEQVASLIEALVKQIVML